MRITVQPPVDKEGKLPEAQTFDEPRVMPWKPPTNRRSVATKRRRRPADKIRSSGAYQRFRAAFRQRWPLCCDPFGTHAEADRIEPTAHVHHVVPIEQAPDRALDETNCAPLCTACHGRVEQLASKGKETARLFVGFQREQAAQQ